VVAIFVLLSVFVKADEDIIGCEENVVIPAIVHVDESVPITIEPVPKFEPMVIDAVEEFACNTFTVAVDTFRTDVFVVVACTVPIVPVVDCRVVIVPEVACKELIVAVEELKTDVFVLVACKLVIVPVVDCRVDIVPEVA